MALWQPYSDALDLSQPRAQETQISQQVPVLPPRVPENTERYVPVTPTFPLYGGYFYGRLDEQLPPRVPENIECYVPQQPAAPALPLYSGYVYGGLDNGSPVGNSSGYTSNSIATTTPESPFEATEVSDDPEYEAFEQEALRVMAEKNGGALVGNHPRMRRSICASAAAPADAAYRLQRERNNVAAKLSRDRRKMREIRLALKANYLQKKVAALEAQLKNKFCVNCNRSRAKNQRH